MSHTEELERLQKKFAMQNMLLQDLRLSLQEAQRLLDMEVDYDGV